MNDDAMAAYRGLMEEIRYRVEAIDSVLERRVLLRARIAEELCYLQLRMICELIAVGCLIIHGDLSAKKADLMKSYQADRILRGLDQLHPKFFPVALELEDAPTTPPSWVHKKDGYLTKSDLMTLYTREAGGILHRGSAKNILAKDREPRFNQIGVWKDKIVGLLNRHIITSRDERNIGYFIMRDENGRVSSNTFLLVEDEAEAAAARGLSG